MMDQEDKDNELEKDNNVTHLHPKPVEVMGKDVVAGGMEVEKFNKILKVKVEYILKSDVLLDKIEDIMFEEKQFNSLMPSEVLALYNAVTYRAESSQRYLLRIMDIASRNEILKKYFEEGVKEDAKGPQMPPGEKAAARVLRNLILDRIKDRQE
jgi:hypothetical protein